jgi:hypothetical protein
MINYNTIVTGKIILNFLNERVFMEQAGNANLSNIILSEFNKNVGSFSDQQIGELSMFFSNLYAEKFNTSKKDLFASIINEGLPKLVGILSPENKKELKRGILEILSL